MPELCKTLSVPFKPVGSLVVAFSDDEMETLHELLERGKANGVPGLEIYDAAKLREEEPHISEEAKDALWAPTAGIVCPYELTVAAVEKCSGQRHRFHPQLCCLRGSTMTAASSLSQTVKRS